MSKAQLLVVFPGEKHTFDLKEDEIKLIKCSSDKTIGKNIIKIGGEIRVKKSELTEKISRKHLVLKWNGSRYVLHDQSTYGTWVGGSFLRNAHQIVENKDKIQKSLKK